MGKRVIETEDQMHRAQSPYQPVSPQPVRTLEQLRGDSGRSRLGGSCYYLLARDWYGPTRLCNQRFLTPFRRLGRIVFAVAIVVAIVAGYWMRVVLFDAPMLI